ncbi:MAG: hypothetical protein JXB17_07370, partial [Bacteroidales bacterium]|nr:hypothetical protein [Bacteroidales bacterium]
DSNSYITLKLVTFSDDEEYIPNIDYLNFPTNMYNKDKNSYYLYFTEYLKNYIIDGGNLANKLYIVPKDYDEYLTPKNVILYNTNENKIKISILYHKLK